MGKDQRKQTDTGRRSRSQSNSSSGSGSYDSPIKKSVVSKVERAQGPLARDRNRINSRRPVERTDVSQDRSRPRGGFTSVRASTSSATRPLSNPRRDIRRSSSLDRRPRSSLSPMRQPDNVRLNPREGRQNRSLSKERLIARDSRGERSRYSHSPVRNMGTMDNNMPFDQFQGIRSPYGGPGHYRRDDSFRDRGGNRFQRGRGAMDNDRSRSFDRQNNSRGFNYFSGGFDRHMPNRGASPVDFKSKDRHEGPSVSLDNRPRAFTAGQKSPVPLLSIQIEKRSNKSQRSVSVERRKSSPKMSPDFKRKDRNDRPNVNLDRNRSPSTGQKSPSVTKASKNGKKSNKSNRSVSNEKKNDSPDTSPEKPISSKKKDKQKKKENDVADSDQNLDRRSNISKVSKSSKKSDDKDDSVERSFERSKLSLGASAHADVLDFNDDIPVTSPSSSGMLRSKRQRENSDLELESPKKKVKTKEVKERLESDKEKSKETKKKDTKTKKSFDSTAGIEKSSSISPKKTVSNKKAKALISRSPSPSERKSTKLNRPLDPDRSKSDISFGRHDMTRFESEPESGEITDSDDETEKANRQALKSLINKPLEEGFADERYLNARKKAMLLNKRDEDGKMAAEDKDKSNKRKTEDIKEPEPKSSEPAEEPSAKKPKVQDTEVAAFTGRTGGAYIPPARLRAMQAKITDKSSVEFQRISWEALKKSINGLVNKINVANIENIVRELFQENIVRGRGLMARSIIQAQAASPTFTHVYAALVAVVNTKFPQNGELILRRLIIQFRRGYKRNDKAVCLTSTQFIAHLLNQQVAHEVLVLEILTLLLDTPTDDSVEVAIGFLKECGQKLTDVSPRGINGIFERLRNILHEGQIDTRVQYMVEVMFAVRKDKFKDHPAIIEELDLVEDEDQFTHLLNLEETSNGEDILNVFKPDPAYLENEEKYKILKKEILGEGSSDEDEGSGSGSGNEEDSGDSDNEEDEKAKQTIIDQTETNMVALRRTIYLTIQSSLDFEECAHKLMKMELKPGQEVELCSMILDCCAQMRTFEKFFGLLAGRFCMIDRKYVTPFQVMFKEQYDTIHRLETNKLRNVAKFFAHLLFTDAISWEVLQCIKLNEDDTTSASRIFIKILFQELSEYLGLQNLNERLKDPTLHEYFTGIMPCDNPRDTRFAINFFTTIGLGGLTDDLRDHLKEISKQLMQQKQEEQAAAAKDVPECSDDDSSGSSSEDSGMASSDSESSSDSHLSEGRKRKPADKNLAEGSRKGKPDKDLKLKVLHKKKETVVEKNKSRDKGAQRKRNTNEESVDKSDAQTVKKKDDKKKVQKGQTEEDARLEREEHFKKLATLANYGDIYRITREYEKGVGKAERKEKRKEKKHKDKKEKKTDKKRENENFGIGMDVVRSDFHDREERGRIRDRSRDQLDSSQNLERSIEGGFESKDGRMSGREDVLRGRDNREGREGEKKGRKGKGQGKKDRGFVQDDDRAIRVERKFEQMDLYENKFEREREKNVEILRDREEFRDYYKGRERAMSPRGPPPPRERDLSPRGEAVPFRQRDLSPRGLPFRERDPYMGDARGAGADMFGIRPEVPYREHGFERIPDKNRRRESNRGGAERGNFIRRDDRRRR